jgi:hypothetical protein
MNHHTWLAPLRVNLTAVIPAWTTFQTQWFTALPEKRDEEESKITGSHGGEFEDGCLLGCCPIKSGRCSPKFQRCLLPPSSGRWGVTAQKTAIFKDKVSCIKTPRYATLQYNFLTDSKTRVVTRFKKARFWTTWASLPIRVWRLKYLK